MIIEENKEIKDQISLLLTLANNINELRFKFARQEKTIANRDNESICTGLYLALMEIYDKRDELMKKII